MVQKTVLLTGAGGGIGSAIKKILEQQGHTVVQVPHADVDLGSYDEINKLAERYTNEQIQFDWLVFAHGYIDTHTELLTQDPENIRKTFEVNTLSNFYLTQLLLPLLNQGGGIVYISSTVGLTPNGRLAAYSASKAAVNALAQAMARNKPEYMFIAIAPGPTNTPMRENLAHDAAKQQSPKVVAEVIARIVSGVNEYKSGNVVVVRDGTATVTT